MRPIAFFWALLFTVSQALAGGAPIGDRQIRVVSPADANKLREEEAGRQNEQKRANEASKAALRQSELAEDERVKAAGGSVDTQTSPECQNGECWSGEGAKFSKFYGIQSTPPPGSVLVSCVFHLVGDRTECGQWSNCQVEMTKNGGVSVKFSMQGHSENGWPVFNGVDFKENEIDFKFNVEYKKATSKGILKSRYMPEVANEPKASTCSLVDYAP